MTANKAMPDRSVLDWLLDSDPSIRWQVMRDLTDARPNVVAAERARIANEGWGAGLLALQTPEGSWGGDSASSQWPSSPEWTCVVALVWLRDMGLDPSSEEARRSVELVRDKVTWRWWDNHPFFVGEVEPCINGRVVMIGSYFGQDVERLVDRLLSEQMADGGWNCEQENGSTRGSFHTTINVLEGLLEHERVTGGTTESRAARLRGQEYLLKRRLLHRFSTGELVDPAFAQLSFPTGYHYDILRALDYLRGADALADERAAEAVRILASKRDAEGRWPLENPHPDQLDVGVGETEGKPSRWITLRALRVLRSFEQRALG